MLHRKKLTPFGREVRKYRVDTGETQADAANAIGVSIASCSAIETGKKNVSNQFVNRVAMHFGLSGQEVESLKNLALIFG
ncbi:MAG: helix-turn-helix domain-containing protein [Methylococcales bacterium]